MKIVPIAVDASHVNTPSLRADFNLGDDKQPASQPHTGHAIEIEVVKARGSSIQPINSLDVVALNNTFFLGPQYLRDDFYLHYADISWRWRKFFRERRMGLEVSAGVGRSSLLLTVISPTQSAAERFVTYGVQGGVGFIWRMRPASSLNVRLSGFRSSAATGIYSAGRFEAYFAQALGENLALHAGYGGWRIRGAGDAYMSSFRVDFSGPTLDVGVNF